MLVSDGELHGFTDTLYKQIRMYYVNDGIYGCFFDCLLYPGWFVPSHFKVIYNMISTENLDIAFDIAWQIGKMIFLIDNNYD